MTSTTDRPSSLEEELASLASTEARLERRADRLESFHLVTVIAAFAGLALGLAGLIVALANTGGSSGPANVSVAAGTPARGAAMGSGMPMVAGMGMRHGMLPPAPVAAAPAGVTQMAVAEGDIWIRPHYTSIGAGKITFVVHNTGAMLHEMIIEPRPIRFARPGVPSEKSSLGEAPDIKPGQTKTLTLSLKPGKYQMFCNQPGHYAAGQHYDFTVTG